VSESRNTRTPLAHSHNPSNSQATLAGTTTHSTRHNVFPSTLKRKPSSALRSHPNRQRKKGKRAIKGGREQDQEPGRGIVRVQQASWFDATPLVGCSSKDRVRACACHTNKQSSLAACSGLSFNSKQQVDCGKRSGNLSEGLPPLVGAACLLIPAGWL
jgi:hypothetical protein